jgi:hypothetical protein
MGGRTGRWLKDLKPRVRKTIRRCFYKFLTLGSARAFWVEIYRRLTTNARTSKLAVIYLRSTTETNDAETTKRALTALALRFGWSRDRLLMIDEGRASGVSEQRPGFKRMLRLIDAGEVGLVVVGDLSRISRDAHHASVFFAKARAAGVSVCTSDGMVA